MKAREEDREKLLKTFTYQDGKLWRTLRSGRKRLVNTTRENHGDGYIVVKFEDTHIYLHRLIYLLTQGPLGPLDQIDHVFGDKLNNSPEVLDKKTNRQNTCNRKTHREGKLVGASFVKASGKWRARCWVDGETCYLGLFPTELEAHLAYMDFCAQLPENIGDHHGT